MGGQTRRATSAYVLAAFLAAETYAADGRPEVALDRYRRAAKTGWVRMARAPWASLSTEAKNPDLEREFRGFLAHYIQAVWQLGDG